MPSVCRTTKPPHTVYVNSLEQAVRHRARPCEPDALVRPNAEVVDGRRARRSRKAHRAASRHTLGRVLR